MSHTHIVYHERHAIARLLAQGTSYHAIARFLKCSVSSIFTEIKNNRFNSKCYDPNMQILQVQKAKKKHAFVR